MEFRLVLLIQFLNVIILLSPRERRFPIRIRRWCRNGIGAFPFGLNSDGFLGLRLDFLVFQHHRAHDHVFPFSKLRKDLQTRNWDPGVSNYKSASGGLLSLTRHSYGSLAFVSASYTLALPRLVTSIILCVGVGFSFHLMFLSFGIRELLLIIKNRDINLRIDDVMALSPSDQLVAPVHDCLGRDFFSSVMELCLHQFGVCWTNLSTNCVETKEVITRLQFGLISENNHRDLLEKPRLALVLEKQYTGAALQPLLCCYAHSKEFQVQFDCESLDCVVDLWLHHFGISEIAMSRLHLGSATYGWELIDTSESGIRDGLVEEIYKDDVFQNDIGTEVLVPLYLHFRIRFGHIGFHATFCEKRFSHKLLRTNRNKEKSNMKLDNNGSSGLLASKATLRKASSNSLLLYFLLVYGAYICVCNNCVSLILYTFVITLLN